MTSATVSNQYPGEANEGSIGDCAMESASGEMQARRTRGVRRRGTMQQGRALETLGHAVEYLVDSGLFLRAERDPQDEQEAIQTLMRLSRAVFLECPEVVPLRRRLKLWAAKRGARWA